jgi:ATP phosphoribosyltransferase
MEQISTLLLGTLEARGRVLVKLNVPAAMLDGVIAILPALKSPTVSKLFGDEAYAVETVVPKSVINTLIPALKDHGATDIIELPISKIVH